MKNIKYIFKGLLTSLLLLLTVSGCESYTTDVIDELLVSRAFSPLDLKAFVRNQTNVELNWTTRDDADHYVVEFSADDETFSSIFKTVNVLATELPVTIALEGETKYSIRVKAVSSKGLEDSKWSIVTATTLSEQIFTSIVNGDILANEATLRWTPNSTVTQITLSPGDITHVITAQEKIAGVATITGLTGETSYTATLLNGTKKRGILSFTTAVDVVGKTVVKPTDDLSQKIANAASGDILVLEPGDYTVYSGEVVLNKSITIRGQYTYDKPLLHVKFKLSSGLANLSLIDLDISGKDAQGIVLTDAYAISLGDANTTYGDILVSGCKVHDFDRSLVYGSVSGSKLNSFTVENTIVKNVNITAGADFIDFRSAYVGAINLKNSTFDSCSIGRDFVRVDAAAGFTATGLTTNILIDGCTLYNVSSNVAGKRILYVRFVSNAITVKNSIFANTIAIYSNQATTSSPVFLNNNYFGADGLITTNTKYDSSTSFTTLDPGFANAATGDFTISNQTLKDNNIGDPRWIE